MASVTLTISKEFKDELKAIPMNWSGVAREIGSEREDIKARWERGAKILEKSKLTQKMADKLSDEFNWAVSKKAEALYKELKSKGII